MAVFVLLSGALFTATAGRTLVLAFGQIVLPTEAMWLFAAVALLAVRHVAHPSPGIAVTVQHGRQRLEAHPHAAAALRAFLVTRPWILLVAYFAVVTFGYAPKVGFTLSRDPLANLPARFDAGWYGDIALEGYEWDRQFARQRNIAFFPALPMLMRPVGAAIGMNAPALPRDKRMLRALWAGVIVSLLAFGLALYYLSRLGGMLSGPAAAAAAPLLLAAYPFAVFFSAPYTESLFLLGSVGAFFHFHRGQWARASLFGLLVGFSRPNGCLVSVPLAVIALLSWWRDTTASQGTSRASLRSLAAALATASMPGVAMLVFTGYLYWLTGVWFAWARMHGAWGRTWGTGPVAQGWEWLTTEGVMAVFEGVPFDTLNTFAVLFAVAMLWLVFRRLGIAYTIFVLVNLVPPIFAGGALSMGRITSTLFPIFIALAATVAPRSIPGWATSFALLQGFVAALFFTWREMF